MTHGEYVASQLDKIRELARGVDSGGEPLDAYGEIYSLAWALGKDGTKIVDVARGIESQIDDLPRGEALRRGSEQFQKAALEKKAAYTAEFGPKIREHCRAILTLCDEIQASLPVQ